MSKTTKLTRLTGCGTKAASPIFNIEVMIDQLKANLDLKVLLGKITHLLDQETRKVLVRVFYEKEHTTFDSGT